MKRPSEDNLTLKQLWSAHERRWQQFDYVYPVLSRRSGGLSIGVNLNPDKVCNWDCVYCQVDRTTPPARRDVDERQLREELEWMVGWAASGEVWADPKFADVPTEYRRINDIAFAGDGEPTTYKRFDEMCRLAADIKAAHRLDDVKIIVLSNMTMTHRPAVQRSFEILDANNGEIWAKLEAGTEAYFQKVDRSGIKLDRLLRNIRDTGRVRPIVIQSLFMKLHGEPISPAEFDAYLDRLAQLLDAGCRIKLVQLYTIARQTTETYARPLSDRQLDQLAERFRARLPNVPCRTYYGIDMDE